MGKKLIPLDDAIEFVNELLKIIFKGKGFEITEDDVLARQIPIYELNFARSIFFIDKECVEKCDDYYDYITESTVKKIAELIEKDGTLITFGELSKNKDFTDINMQAVQMAYPTITLPPHIKEKIESMGRKICNKEDFADFIRRIETSHISQDNYVNKDD